MTDPRFMKFVYETQPDLWQRAQQAGGTVVIQAGIPAGGFVPDEVHKQAVAARDEVLKEAKWYA